MAKIYECCKFLASASRLIRFCLAVVAVWPICHKTVADPIVTIVTQTFYQTESPLWMDPISVFFVADDNLVRYSSDTAQTSFVELNDAAGLKFLVPIKSQKSSDPPRFAVGFASRVGVFEWDGMTTTGLTSKNFLSIDNEFVKCAKGDSNGRLWVGTDSERVYMVDPSGIVTRKLENIGVPHDLTWSPNFDRFYYTTKDTIVSHTFKNVTNELVDDGKVVFNLTAKAIKGVLQGMTVDTDGYLWVACNKNPIVLKINSINGTVLTKVNFPKTSSITSVVFGGLNLKDLYVTTELDDEAKRNDFPSSGALFHVTKTGAKGIGVMEIDVSWPPGRIPGP